MIEAKVIADSKNEFGNRITTMIVTFPRIILAEFNTHRMFSRNSASSRAIPFEKMVKSVEENPFIPIAWQKDHKGMQGTEYHYLIEMLKGCWLDTRDKAVRNALYLSECDVTKQIVNRLLEPFMYHTVIVTATEWENFFALRCPNYEFIETSGREAGATFNYRSKKQYIKGIAGNDPSHELYSYDQLDWLKLNKGQAEIHMMVLAEAMWDAYNESVPKELKAGGWHIPFGDKIDKSLIFATEKEGEFTIHSKPLAGFPHSQEKIDNWYQEQMIKIATARCARVSYTIVGEEDKLPNYENDIKLHDRLAASGHWSPFEHCAEAMHLETLTVMQRDNMWSGNFKGFIQYRKMFNNENITK